MTPEQIKKVVEFTPGWGISPKQPDQWVIAPGLTNIPMHLLLSNQSRIDALAMAAKRHLHETTDYRIVHNPVNMVTALKRHPLAGPIVMYDKPESEATIELISEVV